MLAKTVANIYQRNSLDNLELEQLLLTLSEWLKKYLTREEIASFMLQSSSKARKNDSFMEMIILKGFRQIYNDWPGVINQMTFSQDFLARVLQSPKWSLNKVLDRIDWEEIFIIEALKSALKADKTPYERKILVIFLLYKIETEKVDVEERKKILAALCKVDNINLFELCENKGLVKSTQIQEIQEYSPVNLLFYGYKKGDEIFAGKSKNTTYLLNCLRKATDDKHHEFIETVITNVRGFTELAKVQSFAWITALKKALREEGTAFIRLVCDRVDVRALSQNQSLLKYAFQNNKAVYKVDTDTIKLILEAHASTYTEDEIKELLQLILEKNHIGITEDNWYRTARYLMRQISINNTLTLDPETLPNQKFRDLYSSWQKQVEIAKQIVETNESFMLYSKSKDEIIDALHVLKQKVLLIMLNVWGPLEQECKIILSNIQTLFQQYNQGSLVADRVKSTISYYTNRHINSLQKIFDGQRYLIPMMDLWEMKSIREAVMQHQSACQAYNQSGRHPKIKDQGIEICINNDFCRGLLNKFNQKNPFTAYYVHLETSIAHSMRQIESIITHAIWPGSDPMGNGVTSLIMSFIRWDRYQLEDCHGPLAVIATLFDKAKWLGGADDTHGYLLAQSGNKVRPNCILDPNTICQVTAALATDSKRERQEEPSSSSSSSSLVTGNKRARPEESSSSSSSSCASKRPIVDGR